MKILTFGGKPYLGKVRHFITKIKGFTFTEKSRFFYTPLTKAYNFVDKSLEVVTNGLHVYFKFKTYASWSTVLTGQGANQQEYNRRVKQKNN